jgi:hypothetical protein
MSSTMRASSQPSPLRITQLTSFAVSYPPTWKGSSS